MYKNIEFVKIYTIKLKLLLLFVLIVVGPGYVLKLRLRSPGWAAASLNCGGTQNFDKFSSEAALVLL